MLYVLDDGTIRLTRGDTARFTIPITNETNGEEYSIQSGDILCLTIKKSGKDYEPLIQKSVKGTNVIKIDPLDTKELPFNKYKYDVQLTTEGGDVYTIIEPHTFEIMEEIT